MTFDVGHRHKDVLEIRIPSVNFDFYLFDAPAKKAILQAYLTLTGAPYLPPKWAFGYQQCRYSYPDAASVQNVAEQFRALDIPCDAIGMDIDYMVGYKVFTLDEEKFPQVPAFVQRLKTQGFRLVPIIDAGVKIEAGYDVFEEGKAKGYFCVDADGQDFVAAVWPGLCHFPDFQRADVREWWGRLYQTFTDAGIEGFWNDMNEPAIFYVPDVLKELRDKIQVTFSKDDLGRELIDTGAELTSIFNRRDYYARFFQRAADGSLVNHENIHNLYAFNMTRGTAEQLARVMPDKRYFLLSRGSYAGLQRFAGIWTGDNSSWWEHLLLNMHMLMSLNVTGFFYVGADIGGFSCEPSAELLVRWMQVGVFSPLYRNHSWFGVRQQEPWAFESDTLSTLRDVIRLRYALLPYMYTEYMRAVRELTPLIAPLAFDFPGARAREVEDQFLFGRSLMIAPVYTPNTTGRFVHLPECRWLHWAAARYEDRTMHIMQPGDYYVSANLHEIPVFLRENQLTVLAEPLSHTGERPLDKLMVIGLVTEQAEFTYYEDDGETYAYRDGQCATLTIRVRRAADGYVVTCEKAEAARYALQVKELICEIYDGDGRLHASTVTVA